MYTFWRSKHSPPLTAEPLIRRHFHVTNLPGPMLLKGGLECHALTFRRDRPRHNEHRVPPERFLEELSAG
jgi:hypothetical protein